MNTQNLIFNIYTFDWPKSKVAFYFSKLNIGRNQRIHKSLFPVNIESTFPGINRDSPDFMYTTFTGQTEDYTPHLTDFKTENPDLVKRFYNRQINYYFRVKLEMIVKVDFIKQNQIWVKAAVQPSAEYQVYERYTLKVQLANISQYPELVVSYDGKSMISNSSIASMITKVAPENFNWVLYENRLIKYSDLAGIGDIDYEKAYPVLGRRLKIALGFPVVAPPKDNRYKSYLNKITAFHTRFLDTPQFREYIPLHTDGLLPVPLSKINTAEPDSNKLAFGSGFDIVPYNGVKNFGPFKKAPYNKIHLFFIVHKDDREVAIKLKGYFEDGLNSFKGLFAFAKLLFHTSEGFSIVFQDKNNPVKEIEKALYEREINPDLKYVAIYVTPYTKFEADIQKREIYYKVKEILLKRNITSQCIEANKVMGQGENYVYSLPNIAIAMLAKLDGIPWRLNTPVKNELIVGVGAFKHVASDVQFIGSAFSFNNTGGFNRFEYFMKHEVDILAGSIARAVREYATVNNAPDRLIIHFYKTMSEQEIVPIEQALSNLGLTIPVFIVTINKTESEDIVVFDLNWPELMPFSSTYVNIGSNRYLLCNNTRYSNSGFNANDGFPFPIKLKIECTDKFQLSETRIIKELINQVYQFSRMYWKSVRQQNLPVTIKYPEMVARIAPHFDDVGIPAFGKDNLWFL